jgi:hypothetical protein
MQYEVLSKHFRYCKERHRIIRISDGKVISPTDEGVAVLSEPLEGFRMRLKYDVVCWVLGNKKNVPEGCKIIHINLDPFDYRLKNLKCISNTDVLRVKEAKRNMEKDLTIRSHPSDRYAFLVQYVLDRKKRNECYYDISAATRRYKELQLKFAKILSKYHNSEF